MPKYKNRKLGHNDNSLFDGIFEKRGVTRITQYRTMPFTGLDFDTIMVQEYIWMVRDSLHKLSQTFYNTYDLWWVIAFVNQKPTDAHYKVGDKIYIPSNPQKIANQIGR